MPDDLKTEAAGRSAEDELYEMANLYPRTTGLPMTVRVSPRGNARHDVRIKVNMTHGSQMNIDNTAVVAVHSSPHLISGGCHPTTNERSPVGSPSMLQLSSPTGTATSTPSSLRWR